jgi:hypothetical protein
MILTMSTPLSLLPCLDDFMILHGTDYRSLRDQLDASSLNGSAYFQGQHRQAALLGGASDRSQQLNNQLQDRLARYEELMVATVTKCVKQSYNGFCVVGLTSLRYNQTAASSY